MKKLILCWIFILFSSSVANAEKIEVINGDGTKTVTYCPKCVSPYVITVPIHPTSTMTFEYDGTKKIAAIKAIRTALGLHLGIAKAFIEDNVTSDGKLIIDTSAYDSELIQSISDAFVTQGYSAPTIQRRLKKIYTVEEATKLSKDTGNTFKLRYK